MLRKTNYWGYNCAQQESLADVNTINAYFTSVSTDPQYSSQVIMDELDSKLRLGFPSGSPQVPIAQYCQHDITVRLAMIKKTATVADEWDHCEYCTP